MRFSKVLRVLALFGVALCASSAFALPLIQSVTEFGTMNAAGAKALDTQGPVVSSASSPGPGAAPNAALVDESYQYSDRTHEWTAPRTNAQGVLTTDASGTLRAFPYYMQGLEYIQTSNDNRDMTDYRLDVTLNAPVTAFLMIDNRNNGPAALNNDPNTNDPILGGPLQWVIDDGWTRVKSGQMPNNQADYFGTDEGATVATAAERTHTAAGNVAGSGNGLNQFFAIYRKDFAAGTHVGFTKQNGIPGGATYGVAVSAPVGPILAGDANNNGVVDINDYTIIRNNFNGTNKTRATGDVNFDTVVNFADFRVWKNNRTAGAAGGAMTDAQLLAGLGIPEPSSMALLTLGALASFGVGRRRVVR